MNHSTEIAEETTGKVTVKALLAVARHAVSKGYGHLFMHGQATHGRPSYADSFTFDVTAEDGTTSRGHTSMKITVPGCVRGGKTSKRESHTYEGRTEMRYCEAYRPHKGFWSLMGHVRETVELLEMLPRDAEVSIEVHLDAGTNQYQENATSTVNGTEIGLHTDYLYLCVEHTVRGKKRTTRFLLDSSNGPHNSARFGSPRHAEDPTGRSDW